jgi:PAS domain S-box-containing protein
MDAAPVGVTITDPGQPNNPLIYANDAFERITGYDEAEASGKNMRFLQGPGTDDQAIARLRDGIANQEPTAVTLANYRKDGTRFWNRVTVAPVYDSTGELSHYVGFQTDVTEDQIRQQRLSVLNRILRHNLSNDLNIIQGYADTLVDIVEDPDAGEMLRQITKSSEKLNKLSRDANRIEGVLDHCGTSTHRIDVIALLNNLCEELKQDYDQPEISVSAEDGPWHVNGSHLEDTFRELFENAIEHNERATPVISVSVGPARDSTDRLEVRIKDNGPGIEQSIANAIQNGNETPLNHGDGFGLWLVYWIVSLVGGDLDLNTGQEEGTTVMVKLPTAPVSPP